MKKRVVFVLLGLCLLFSVVTGCKPGYRFVKAAVPVDILKQLLDYGGIAERITVRTDGSFELAVRFGERDKNAPVSCVQAINEQALSGADGESEGKRRYAAGERVVAVKDVRFKSGTGNTYATVYGKSAEHLNFAGFDAMPLSYYLERYSVDNIRFADRSGKAVSPKNLNGKSMVLVIGSNAAQKDIVAKGGKIVAASYSSTPESSVLEYGKNKVRYFEDACVIVYAATYQTLIIVVSVSVAVVLAAVFLILVKLGVFTNLKLKSERKEK